MKKLLYLLLFIPLLSNAQYGGRDEYLIETDSLTIKLAHELSPVTVKYLIIDENGGVGYVTEISSLADYLPLAGGTMDNTNLVTNLNADLLDGQHGTYYQPISTAWNTSNSGSTSYNWSSNVNNSLQYNLNGNNLFNLTSGYLPYWTGSVFDGSPAYTDGTNIGIGTTSPDGVLDIEGPTSDGYALIITDGSANSVGGGFYFDTAEGLDMVLKKEDGTQTVNIDGRSGANRNSWINNGGSFGIGTTSPSAKLHVNGSAIINDKLLINTTTDNGIDKLQVNGSIRSQDHTLYKSSGTAALNIGSGSGLTRNYDFKTDGNDLFINGVLSSSGLLRIGENGIYPIGMDLGTGSIMSKQLNIDDASTYIDRDGSNNMTFTDAVTGTKTLASLLDNATHTGEVTGATALTVADNVIDYANVDETLKQEITDNDGTFDMNAAGIINCSISSNTTFSFSNIYATRSLAIELTVSSSATVSWNTTPKSIVGDEISGNGTYLIHIFSWGTTEGDLEVTVTAL